MGDDHGSCRSCCSLSAVCTKMQNFHFRAGSTYVCMYVSTQVGLEWNRGEREG